MDGASFEARLKGEGFPEIRTNEFSMKAGCPHAKDVGPSGVKYLVGRRPVR